MNAPPSAPLIGLYGGSFDPVHLGHLETARELLARFPFTELRLLPAALSPLKQGHADAQHRLAMLQLAVADTPRLTVDDRELRRPPPSYTIDTLRAVRAELGPTASLVFVLGHDSFLSLPRWRDWRALTDYAHLLVVTRPGHDAPADGELAEWLAPRRSGSPDMLEFRACGTVTFVATQPWPVSSTEIRQRLAAGEDVVTYLPQAVTDYLRRHHLYV